MKETENKAPQSAEEQKLREMAEKCNKHADSILKYADEELKLTSPELFATLMSILVDMVYTTKVVNECETPLAAANTVSGAISILADSFIISHLEDEEDVKAFVADRSEEDEEDAEA